MGLHTDEALLHAAIATVWTQCDAARTAGVPVASSLIYSAPSIESTICCCLQYHLLLCESGNWDLVRGNTKTVEGHSLQRKLKRKKKELPSKYYILFPVQRHCYRKQYFWGRSKWESVRGSEWNSQSAGWLPPADNPTAVNKSYYYYYYYYQQQHQHHLLYAGYLYLYSWDKLCP